MWLASPEKSPYQCTGMKSAEQLPAHAVKKDCSHVKPAGLPVTAGAPSFTPLAFSGSTFVFQSSAAVAGSTLLPPVSEVPSGSLKVSTCETLVPLLINASMVVRKVVSESEAGAPHSIGMKARSVLARATDGDAP